MAKETFIIRAEWFDAINELDDAGRSAIFTNLFHYHRGEENLINLNNLSVKLVWKLIEPSLKRSVESYDKRCETSRANGRRGGRPRSKSTDSDNLKTYPNLTDNLTEPIETLSDRDSDLDKKEKSAGAQDFEKGPLLAVNRPNHAPTWAAVRELFAMSNGTDPQAFEFFGHHEDRGWRDEKGRPFVGYAGLVNGWISKAAEKASKAAEKQSQKQQSSTYQPTERDEF